MLVDINERLNQDKLKPFALFELAFRPFFLFGTLFAIVHITLWLSLYSGFAVFKSTANMPIFYWHGHEMVFGYCFAIIAGFLLTAVVTWTGQMSIRHKPLMIMAVCWVLARLFFILDNKTALIIAMVFDLAANLILVVAFARPCLLSKNYRQMGLVSKTVIMFAANLLFYLSALGVISAAGMRMGIYLGFYIVIAVILVLLRRVLPFFISRGVGYKFECRNNDWVDRISLLFFTVFVILDVFYPIASLTALAAFALFALHLYRLQGWYTKGVLKVPLLWSLCAAYFLIVIGFLLKALSFYAPISPFIALHCFAYGGFGLVTLAMMSRVSLGHTGRSIHATSPWVKWIFICMLLGVFFRVGLPMILTSMGYLHSILLSGVFWVIAFSIYVAIYMKPLLKPRLDGRPG